MPARLPDDEAERLAVLQEHQILDTQPEEEYDDLVRLAAHVCGVPIAAISLIDEHRQWFKAITGLTVTETPRDASFCAHTILQNGLMIVPDAQVDARFADNPAVTGDSGIRFYAGVPLITSDGFALGSLCVVDRTPRNLTFDQQATLSLLARQVSSHLKSARQVAERERLLAEKEEWIREKERFAVIAMQEVRERELAERELARLAAIVESSEEAIIGATLDGIIGSWNKGAERLYGYTADEMIGQNSCVLAGPDQHSPVPEAVIRLLRSETIEPLEVLRQRKDGTRFYALLSFSPIRDALGQTVGLSCIARDITARKQAETLLAQTHAALRESEARFRTSVGIMEEGLVLQNEDGAILFCNESAERILGMSADQMMDRTSTDPRWRAIREDGSDFPDEQHPAMVALREGIPRRNVVMGIPKPDGDLTWINVNAVLMRPTLQEKPQQNAFGGRETQKRRSVVVTFSDITERQRTQEVLWASHGALEESQARLAEAQQVAQIGSWEFDIATRDIVWSDELFRLFEMDPSQGAPSLEAVRACYHPDDVPTQMAISNQAMQDGLPYELDIRILRRDGSFRWVHAVGRGEHDEKGHVTRLFGTLMDVTERRLSEERFRVLFEQSPHAHLLFDESGGIIDCNTATLSMMHCTDKTQLLSIHPALLSPEFQPDGRRSSEKGIEMCALARREGVQRFEWMRRAADGYEFPVEVTLTPVTLAGKPILLSVWHDLTERKKYEEEIKDHAIVLEYQMQELEAANAKLEALATTDGMTGLRNHRAFQERLTQEVVRATRYHTPLSVVLLDVDKFKQYNDAYGHPAGDDVLRQVSNIIQSCARGTDLAARYGGEEFVLILPQTDGDGAVVIAERVRNAIELAQWPKRAITASLGVSSLSLGMDDGDDLITRADAALYQSKSEGRNRVTRHTGSQAILR